MGRPPLCNAMCADPFPDCFGCPVLEVSLPQVWQLDFPAVMDYQGSQSATCSWSTLDPVGSNPRYSVEGDYDHELPDIDWIGNATQLQIDDALVTGSSNGIVECIWGAALLHYYEYGQLPAIAPPTLLAPGCPQGADPDAFVNLILTTTDYWRYNGIFSPTPQGVSPGRTRETVVADPADSRCDTHGHPACNIVVNGLDEWSCRMLENGVVVLLRVTLTAGVYYMTVTVHLFPLVHWRYLQYQVFPAAPAILVAGTEFYAITFVTASDLPTACFATAFPYATSPGNVGQGTILTYSKAIDCDTDFTGAPVVLPLTIEHKRHSAATQTIVEALGITNVPSTITITPL